MLVSPPERLVQRARAALEYATDSDLTTSTFEAAQLLAAGAAHTTEDLKTLRVLHGHYYEHPVRVALLGGDDGLAWAAEALKAAANPSGIDFDRLSSTLTGIDETAARELVAVCNVIIGRVLERLGRMIKGEAKRVIRNHHSFKLDATLAGDVRTLKARLPFSVRALLTLDEEATVRRMLEEDLRPEALRILTEADQRAIAAVAGAVVVEESAVRAAVPVPIGVRVERAVDMLVSALTASIVARVNAADEANEDSELEGAVEAERATVNAGIVKDTIAAAAGAATTPAGGVNRVDGTPVDSAGTPLRSEGLASSGLVMAAIESVLAEDGKPTTLVTEYVWHHNTVGVNVREDHAALDGVRWRTASERFDRIGKNSTSQRGCNCTVETRLIAVPLGDI